MKILPPSSSRAQRATWWLCLLVWCQPILIGYIITVINKLTEIPYDFFYDYLMSGIYIVLSIIAIPYISKRIKASDWMFYFAFLVVFFGSYFLVPENRECLGALLTVIPFSMLPLYFLGVSFDIEPLKKQLYILSIISIAVQILFYRLLMTTNIVASIETEDYDHFMHISYQVLPYVLYVIWYAFDNANWLNVSFSIIGFIFIVLLGTRGSFLSCLVFIVVYLIVFKQSQLSVIQKTLIVIGGVLLYFGFSSLLTKSMDLFSTTGASTRIIGWLLGVDEGTKSSTEDRIGFANLAFETLKNSGFWGLGFAGDRLIMNGYWIHNFVLECLVSYGPFFGILIPFIVFYRLIKGVIRKSNYTKRGFLLLLIGLGMIPLFVSGSYVNSSWFYLMLGYCTQLLRMPKSQQSHN